eukprot:gene556-biopygen6772
MRFAPLTVLHVRSPCLCRTNTASQPFLYRFPPCLQRRHPHTRAREAQSVLPPALPSQPAVECTSGIICMLPKNTPIRVLEIVRRDDMARIRERIDQPQEAIGLHLSGKTPLRRWIFSKQSGLRQDQALGETSSRAKVPRAAACFASVLSPEGVRLAEAACPPSPV